MPQTAEKLLDYALKAGAEQADVIESKATSLQTAMRLGNLEELERAESGGIGLRVFIGKKQGMASGSDMRDDSLKTLAERAVAIAKLAPEDEFCGLADDGELAKDYPDLKLSDSSEPSPEWLLNQCKIAEDEARSVKGITNSEGASAGFNHNKMVLVTSQGFRGGYARSSYSLSASVLAGQGDAMERDYAYKTVRFQRDMPDAKAIGAEAAERTLKRLNPKQKATCKVPVVFDRRISKNLLGSFSGAISGAAIARGTSFLKDKMGQAIFNESVTIEDDPHRISGLGSRPFDGEGCKNEKILLVDKGVLNHWLLDSRSARQLGLAANGRASRGLSSPPSPSTTNLSLLAGADSLEVMIADIKDGFYVTDTFGMGINMITGDYSQGASGFWIENGKLAYAVSEMTIASTLQEMFMQLMPANDLHFDYATNAPTLMIKQMTVAGS